MPSPLNTRLYGSQKTLWNNPRLSCEAWHFQQQRRTWSAEWRHLGTWTFRNWTMASMSLPPLRTGLQVVTMPRTTYSVGPSLKMNIRLIRLNIIDILFLFQLVCWQRHGRLQLTQRNVSPRKAGRRSSNFISPGHESRESPPSSKHIRVDCQCWGTFWKVYMCLACESNLRLQPWQEHVRQVLPRLHFPNSNWSRCIPQ